MSLTPAQEAEMRALAAAATPGPWHVGKVNNEVYGNDHDPVADACLSTNRSRANAAFIAAANPATILALLDELAAVRGALRPFVEEFERHREAYLRRGERHIMEGNFDRMPDHWPVEKFLITMGQCRAARAHLATPADLSLATEDFPLGRCHRCGEPIADQDKGNEGCEDPHCPTLP